MSFSDTPKRIVPPVPTRKEFHDFPEKGKANLWRPTSAPVSSGPKSESQCRGPFSTRYREPSGVKRRLWPVRSNRLTLPNTPSSNSITMRPPLVETLAIECPGLSSCCAYEKLTINSSPHQTKTLFGDKPPTRLFTSSPVRQRVQISPPQNTRLCVRKGDGPCVDDDSSKRM